MTVVHLHPDAPIKRAQDGTTEEVALVGYPVACDRQRALTGLLASPLAADVTCADCLALSADSGDPQ